MTIKVNVTKTDSGKWMVKSGQHAPIVTYPNKVDAVAHARRIASEKNVVIHNSTGQILPHTNIKTSVPKNKLRNAVTASTIASVQTRGIANNKTTRKK